MIHRTDARLYCSSTKGLYLPIPLYFGFFLLPLSSFCLFPISRASYPKLNISEAQVKYYTYEILLWFGALPPEQDLAQGHQG